MVDMMHRVDLHAHLQGWPLRIECGNTNVTAYPHSYGNLETNQMNPNRLTWEPHPDVAVLELL